MWLSEEQEWEQFLKIGTSNKYLDFILKHEINNTYVYKYANVWDNLYNISLRIYYNFPLILKHFFKLQRRYFDNIYMWVLNIFPWNPNLIFVCRRDIYTYNYVLFYWHKCPSVVVFIQELLYSPWLLHNFSELTSKPTHAEILIINFLLITTKNFFVYYTKLT